ncbi:hypothetical protein GBZ48_13065 [Azospirillum melinis]|uniref:Uncharacterized protein n=1 Tax=Azospirillum melinis TaxID=328839 RepID=A0ABX2KEL2_9PROT|nr:hypothetical protein [Azospirillum melinis]MBP2306274.1 hypothetical protein [Azospirillum melinis]NUB00218.1 hypothetical protein [Azospirillum melinis]
MAMFFIRTSGWLKIFARIIGFAGAAARIVSAYAEGQDLVNLWNGRAAIVTAVAVFLQAASSLIDAKYPPLASWG